MADVVVATRKGDYADFKQIPRMLNFLKHKNI